MWAGCCVYRSDPQSHPDLIRYVNLKMGFLFFSLLFLFVFCIWLFCRKCLVPSVEMVDDHGRVIEEKIYKTGSTIELKCVVSKVPGPTANIMWRHGLRILNYDTSRGGIR